MFFRKTKKINKLHRQLEKINRDYRKMERENEVLKLFLKEMEIIQGENHYGSLNNYANKIKSAISDVHRLLHF